MGVDIELAVFFSIYIYVYIYFSQMICLDYFYASETQPSFYDQFAFLVKLYLLKTKRNIMKKSFFFKVKTL